MFRNNLLKLRDCTMAVQGCRSPEAHGIRRPWKGIVLGLSYSPARCFFVAALVVAIANSTRMWADADPQSPTDAADVAKQEEAFEPADVSDDPLPWDSPTAGEADVAPDAPANAREALHTLTIEESDLLYFYDRQPFDPVDDTLIRILYRLPTLRLDYLVRYAEANQDVDLNEIVNHPKKHFAQAFRVSGRAMHISTEKLMDSQVRFYDFDHYYRVVVDVKDLPNPIIVCAREIPEGWKTAKTLDEPTSCYAIFLKPDESQPEAPPLVFAAPRMAWHPDEVDPDLGVVEDHLLLSRLGMDYSLFDDVRPNNARRLVEGDTECFYQLFAALQRAEPEELRRQAGGRQVQGQLANLLTKPEKFHGQFMMVEGLARRIQPIKVDNTYYSHRLGIDEYYEIDMLIRLEQELQISYRSEEEGAKEVAKSPVYRDEFPVVVCVRRLPDDVQAGDDVKYRLKIPACFFKLWVYKSRRVDEEAPGQLQRSPLFLALEPQRVPEPEMSTSFIGYIAVIVFVVALGGLWLGLWLAGRRDDKFEAEHLRRRATGTGKPLDSSEIESSDKPDFSGLE